jgi:hypothetical protein
MIQKELPLDHSLLSLMESPDPKMGWRRAHERKTESGLKVTVSLVVLNGDKGPKERTFLRQIPEVYKRPVRSRAQQLEIFT